MSESIAKSIVDRVVTDEAIMTAIEKWGEGFMPLDLYWPYVYCMGKWF